MSSGSLYLGNQLIFGKNRSKDFGRLKDRVQAKLEGWRNHLLSRAGKATLIKSVVQAIPQYTMSTFRVPDGVCNELDALIRKFWWGTNKSGRFLALKCWDSICQPKEFGGLGFRKFRDINSALLSKLGWNLLTEENKLWISLVKAKYLKNSNFFDYHLKNGVSFSWRSIVTAREVLRKGVLFNLEDDKSIRL